MYGYLYQVESGRTIKRLKSPVQVRFCCQISLSTKLLVSETTFWSFRIVAKELWAYITFLCVNPQSGQLLEPISRATTMLWIKNLYLSRNELFSIKKHILLHTVGVSVIGGTLLGDIQCASVGPENTEELICIGRMFWSGSPEGKNPMNHLQQGRCRPQTTDISQASLKGSHYPGS